MAIRRQLRTASGLLGYSLDADLVRGQFWTLSAWADRESLDAFAQTDPHRSRVARIRPRMRPTKFVFCEAMGHELPIGWSEARRRLEADSY
jgi:quinol monooxygenase YgiN